MSDEKIKVEFGADTGNLQEGTDSAAAAVEGFSARAKAAFASAAETSQASMEEISLTVKESAAQVQESMEGFAGAIHGIQNAFMLFGEVMMAGFIGERVLEMGKSFAEFGDELERTSQKTGMTVGALQALKFAAEMNDVSFETLNKGLKKLAMSMNLAQQGSAQAVEAFAEVGISADQLSHMSLEEALKRIADKYHDTADGAGKMANAQLLLGRGGSELIPLLDQGGAAIDEYGKKAREMGAVMSDEEVKAAKEMNEELKLLHQTTQTAERHIASAFAPALLALAQAFNESWQKGGLFKEISTVISITITTVAEAVEKAVAGLRMFILVIAAAGAAASAVAHLHFAEAKNIIKALGADLEAEGKKIQDFHNKLLGLGKSKPEEAEGGEKPKKDLPQIQVKSGGKSRVADWKSELEEKKLAEDNYLKSSLSDNLAYWENIQATEKLNAKEKQEVQHEILTTKKQMLGEELSAEIANLKAKQEAAHSDYQTRISLEDQIIAEVKQFYGQDSKEYAAALKEKERLLREYQQNQIRSAEEALDHQKQLDLISIDMQTQALNFKKQMGQISNVEELDARRQLEDDKYNIELQAAINKAALLEEGTIEQKKALDEIEVMEQQHQLKIQEMNQQRALAVKSSWEQMFSGVTSAIETSIKGLIMGTQTLQRAVATLGQAVISEFVNMAVKKAASWLSSELAMTAATTAGTAQRTAIEAAASAESLVMKAATGLKTIMMDAYKAAAGAFSATADIPIVGPILAPEAAAGALAEVSGFAGSIASAAGGWEVPKDTIAQVHKNEMILPANLSDRIRNMTEPNGGGHTFHNSFHISALDAPGVKELLTKHGGDIIGKIIGKQLRDFQKI